MLITSCFCGLSNVYDEIRLTQLGYSAFQLVSRHLQHTQAVYRAWPTGTGISSPRHWDEGGGDVDDQTGFVAVAPLEIRNKKEG